MRCVKCGEPVQLEVAADAMAMDLPPCCDECRDDVSEESFNGHSFWPEDWYGHWAWSSHNDVFCKHPVARVKKWA